MPSKLHKVDDSTFKNLTRKALGYALLSAPFTINRMNLGNLGRRIENITKGKLAEHLVEHYCKSTNINADFDSCQTPFYQVDRRDFLYNKFEWDIKNNFISSLNLRSTFTHPETFPALIPNRYQGDQWSKRFATYHKTEGLRFLFTFMPRNIFIKNKKRNIFDLHFSLPQKKLLSSLVNKHGGKSRKHEPYTKEWFWQEWQHISEAKETELLQINFNSPILIAGWAGKEDWHKFKLTDPKKWCDGKLKTIIKNQYMLTKDLHSFG